MELYIEKLNSLVQKNEELKDELELQKASMDAQEKIRDEEAERIRRETKGLEGITFDGNLYSKFIPFKIISEIKFQPDSSSSEDLKETLKRFEQHILDFSYSRGDIQILINSVQRIEVEK